MPVKSARQPPIDGHTRTLRLVVLYRRDISRKRPWGRSWKFAHPANMHPAPQRPVLLAILAAALFLAACSGGSLDIAPEPVFTNAPGTAATQGSTYTYQIQTEPSTGVTLTLANAPSGATLSGNTITWTPTAAQSRVPNQFVVTATTTGGTAAQSWSVTPAGTINGSWIDTYWTPSGPMPWPLDWTKVASGPAALVRQSDGSFQSFQGSGNSDGTFSIPNVPGGYYWLLIGNSMDWTSASNFDFGADFAGQLPPTTASSGSNMTLNINLSGLDPLQTGDEVMFLEESAPGFSFVSPAGSPAGATTFSTGGIFGATFDFAQSAPAFLAEYEPEAIGALSAIGLGPSATLPDLTLIDGFNSFNVTLAPSVPKSFDLSVKGSAWSALFANVAPTPPTLAGANFALETIPFFTATDKTPQAGVNLPLLAGLQISSQPSFTSVAPSCTRSGPFHADLLGEGPITMDEDFGTVNFEDPFPSNWQRVFTLCEVATVPIPFPGSTTPVPFQLVDTLSAAIPTSQLAPAVSQVQNPTLNGSSVFLPNTVAATGASLNWAVPNGTVPIGYKINIFAARTITLGQQTVSTYLPYLSVYTAKNSFVLPPLQSGSTLVFVITTILDGAANFETKPNRSALPTASASVISAPITIQ